MGSCTQGCLCALCAPSDGLTGQASGSDVPCSGPGPLDDVPRERWGMASRLGLRCLSSVFVYDETGMALGLFAPPGGVSPGANVVSHHASAVHHPCLAEAPGAPTPVERS
jgi:hypothetical protein